MLGAGGQSGDMGLGYRESKGGAGEVDVAGNQDHGMRAGRANGAGMDEGQRGLWMQPVTGCGAAGWGGQRGGKVW